MKRRQFIDRLRKELTGLPQREVDDIIADYNSHFEEAEAAGRNSDDVADVLGEPRQLARELRAEAGLRRWEDHRTPMNLMTAFLALFGLAAIDFLLLLPLLFMLGLIALALSFVLLLLGVVGLGNLVSLTPLSDGSIDGPAFSRLLTGLGLVVCSFAGGWLLVQMLNAGMKRLVRYARLHYGLIKPMRGNL